MKLLIDEGSGRQELTELSFQQGKQASAIMDCIGRMIPQEGVDYDVEIIFKSKYDPSVSMNVVPHTDKGDWWKKYVMEMIRKYPPTVENPPQAIDESQSMADLENENKEDDQDEESVS